MNLITRFKTKLAVVAAAICVLPTVVLAEPPAEDGSAIFDAIDVSGLSGNVQAILVTLVGIAVLFLAYRLIRRSLSR